MVVACLVGSGVAGAQIGGLHGDQDPVAFAAPGLEIDHASRQWVEAERLVSPHQVDDPWATFVRTLGDGWLVNRDNAFGTPQWILGPGLETGIVPLDEDAAVAHARTLAARLAGALGIDDLGALKLMRTAATLNRHGHTIFGVDFQQTFAGYDVRTLTAARRVIFRYDLTLGKLSNLGSDWLKGLEVRIDGALSRDAAVARATEILPGYQPGDGRVYGFQTYVLVGIANETEVQARLVHEVEIQTATPPHHWHVILDARTGDKLYVRDGVCSVDVTGNVSLGSLDAGGGTPPAVAFSVKPATNLYVSVQGGSSATTDMNGNFTIPHGGTAQVTVTGRLAGDWCTVQNQAGGNTSFSLPATPGTPVNIVINGTHTGEYTTAEATAYDWVTRTHHYITKRWPGWATLARISRLTTNVNLSNTCNAYWSPATVNFFRSGGGCNNTAFAEVISHEWGHGFHWGFHGSTSPGGFSEGIGDHLGLYITGQRIMGRGFRTTGGSVRDYRTGGSANNTQWPASGKEVHKAGEIWGGFNMDLRDYLITKHGQTQGVDVAETITIAQYSRNPSDMDVGVRETMVQDDNDANLKNGTPNFAEIARAADRHSIPRPPDPLIVQFTHTPLATSRDVVNDYVVSSKITSTEGSITKAILEYQIGSASLKTINLTKGAGDMYSATIPAQPAVSAIAYRLTATDSKLNTASEPASGFHQFSVGHEIVAFQDDFETNKGWTPAGDDNATRGRFERADPNYANYPSQNWVNQPEDDHTPGAGTMCYVTENGQRGQQGYIHDVDNGKTSMISPTFDLSGVPAGAAKISFAYWFTDYIANDDRLIVQASSDGGQGWRTVWSDSTAGPLWKEQKDLVIPAPYSNNMKIMFWTYDLGTGSQTDALIDDVVVNSMDDNVAALKAQTRTPGIGTTLNYTLEAKREPNAAYVAAFSLSLGPITIPGIGTMDLGVPAYPLWQGVTDSAGNAGFKIPVPNAPVLRGLKIHTQSFVAGKANIFSNLWSVDIQ